MNRFHFWDRRIPAIYGIGGLILIIFVLTFMVQQRIIFKTLASPGSQPKKVQVTNITDSSFTVTYTTDDQVLGSIQYGIDKTIDKTALDERDQAPNVTQRYTHSITVKNLKPSTVYYFAIKSGLDTYLDTNNIQYQVTTAPTFTNDSKEELKPLSGKVLSPNGDAASDALVFVSKNSQLLSSPTNATGVYIISLENLRSPDLKQYVEIKKGDTLHITVLGKKGELSEADVTITGDGIVPTITLTQLFDFTTDISPSVPASPSALPVALPTQSLTGSPSGIPQILTPKTNQGFIDPKPQFNGTAQPNADVTIEIHSEENITSTVKANTQGQWTFKVPSTLSPGEHTITISTRDARGILRRITQTFTVYAQGTQVNQTATPSASLAPTKTSTPTPKPTATPTVKPTTAAATPTSSPTPTETITITESVGTPTPTIPPTGSEVISYGGFLGGILVFIGITFYLLAGLL